MSGIKEAVIMAAGLGQRIPSQSTYHPKGFIEIGGQSIIQRSLNILQANGIERVIIGTGHLAEHYQTLQKQYAASAMDVVLVHNAHYASSGSLETLLLCCEKLDGDFITLESDLIYHPDIVSAALKQHQRNIIMASGKTNSGDEVYIEVTKEGCLAKLSKNIEDIDDVYGELIGICRFQKNLAELLSEAISQQGYQRPFDLHYEDGLVAIAKRLPISIEKIDLPWAEIDMLEHLERVQNHIWPQLANES